MKTNVLLIAALIMVTSIGAVAEENPGNTGFAVVPKGTDVFKVIYKTEKTNGRVKMNIYNAESQLIYSETVTGGGFIVPVKFSGLAAGAYTIEIADGSNRVTQTVDYQPAKVSASKKVVHVSRIVGEDEKYVVSLANAGNETVTINIYDNLDRLVHNETRKINGEFAQIYTVKNKKVASIEVIDEAGNRKVSRF